MMFFYISAFRRRVRGIAQLTNDSDTSGSFATGSHAASAPTKPKPENDDRDQGKNRCYQPGDHPKTVRAAAERNPADIHAPDAGDQGRRQENHREHREYVKVSVGFLLDLRSQLFE